MQVGGEKCWQPLLRAEFWNRISSASCGRSDKSLNLRHTQPQPLARATVCSTFGNKTEQWPGTQDNERGRKRKGPGWRCVGLSTGSECRSTQQPPRLQDSSGPLHPFWPVRPKWKGYKIDTRFPPSLRGWKGEAFTSASRVGFFGAGLEERAPGPGWWVCEAGKTCRLSSRMSAPRGRRLCPDACATFVSFQNRKER